MKSKLMMAVKILVPLVSIGVGIAEKKLSEIELDAKIAKKVAEALANSTGKES